MLVEELQKLSQNDVLVSIDRDCHDEELTGFICQVSESVITMQLFTNNGDYDGFTLFETNQIESVWWGNREHHAIQHLVELKQLPDRILFENLNFFDAILELNDQKPSLEIYCSNDEDRFDIGKIEAMYEDWCKITTFSKKATLSPMKRIFRIDSISRVSVDSPYQKSIVALHQTDL